MARDGAVKYSSEILLDHRLCSTFRKGIEQLLRLLLVYDSNRRGFQNSVKKNVFNELKTLLNRKTMKVLSVYDYRCFDYEITASTKLSHVKSYIERDAGIAADLQMFVVDCAETIFVNNEINMIDFFQESVVRTLYVFKKNDDFKRRMITIPKEVQLLLQNTEVRAESLKLLYGRAMLFIRNEKELMEQMDAGLMAQGQHTATLGRNMEKRYSEVRCSLTSLLAEITCYRNCKKWLDLPAGPESRKYFNSIMDSRRCLRQSKELVECFNALTEKYLKLLAMPGLRGQLENTRRSCLLNETNMSRLYDEADKLYKIATSTDTCTNAMVDVLSEVLKVPRKGILNDANLKSNIRCSLGVQRKLEKLWTSCCAIGETIKQVAADLRECEKAMSECQREMYRDRRNQGLSLHFPENLEADLIPIEVLHTNNLSIRCLFQEESNKFSNILRDVQRDISRWNFIVTRPRQNQE